MRRPGVGRPAMGIVFGRVRVCLLIISMMGIRCLRFILVSSAGSVGSRGIGEILL